MPHQAYSTTSDLVCIVTARGLSQRADSAVHSVAGARDGEGADYGWGGTRGPHAAEDLVARGKAADGAELMLRMLGTRTALYAKLHRSSIAEVR